MEERRLIVAEWGVTKNGRRARYYRITPAGRAHLRAESARLVDHFDAVVSSSAPSRRSSRDALRSSSRSAPAASDCRRGRAPPRARDVDDELDALIANRVDASGRRGHVADRRARRSDPPTRRVAGRRATPTPHLRRTPGAPYAIHRVSRERDAGRALRRARADSSSGVHGRRRAHARHRRRRDDRDLQRRERAAASAAAICAA